MRATAKRIAPGIFRATDECSVCGKQYSADTSDTGSLKLGDAHAILNQAAGYVEKEAAMCCGGMMQTDQLAPFAGQPLNFPGPFPRPQPLNPGGIPYMLNFDESPPERAASREWLEFLEQETGITDERLATMRQQEQPQTEKPKEHGATPWLPVDMSKWLQTPIIIDALSGFAGKTADKPAPKWKRLLGLDK